MAITAKFSADFASFEAAVQQAEVSLRGFESGAGKVETSLTRMANSLSGTGLIQQATLMAEAVTRVGGSSTLTEAELARVGSTAAQAAQKLTALGQDVPPQIQALANAFHGAGDATTGWMGILSSLGHSFVARVAEGVARRPTPLRTGWYFRAVSSSE